MAKETVGDHRIHLVRAVLFGWLALISLLLVLGWAVHTKQQEDETRQQTEAVESLCRSHQIRIVERLIILRDDRATESRELRRYYLEQYIPELVYQMRRLHCGALIPSLREIKRK